MKRPVSAELGSRILAITLDYIVIATYLAALGLVALGAKRTAPAALDALFATQISAQLTTLVILTAPVLLYLALLESSKWRGTVGKRVMGLEVVDAAGQPVTRGRSLGRNSLKLLPWELTHGCIWAFQFSAEAPPILATVGLVAVWLVVAGNIASLVVTKTRQTLYDRIAGTFVGVRVLHQVQQRDN